MFVKRFFLFLIIIFAMGCQSETSAPGNLNIGVVSFGESDRSLGQYSKLEETLGRELKSLVDLEPTYNEIKAIAEIKHKRWDLVFAPPGLAAIAISQSKYVPLFPLEGGLKNRSIVVVLKDSPLQNIRELAGKTIILGQPGSATGYYLPIYNLYGLTLSEVRFASTPQAVLKAIANKEVEAGAMSLAEFNQYRADFSTIRFRVLFNDAHEVPSGSVLVSPDLESSERDRIRKALSEVSPAIAASAGYITNAPPPDYQYLMKVVERVAPIADRIKQKPAPFYEQK
jgi:phosphonate transport system substrate-binding protein